MADLVVARVRPDLMGTYGDGGNAEVLVRRVEWRGGSARLVDVVAHRGIPDDADIVVIGGAEDAAQAALLRDRTLTTSLTEHVTGGTSVLAVCAGLQVLGRPPSGDADGPPGLGLIDIRSRRLPHRAVGEVVVEAPEPIGLLSGFENHAHGTVLGPGVRPLGAVRTGIGNGTADHVDGLVWGNVIGTYLHGPVLARNPALADHLLARELGPLEPLDDTIVRRLRRHLLGPDA